MSVAYGSPLSSANTNAAFVSRTIDTDMVGKLENTNPTDSSSVSTGAVMLTGGLGVGKKSYLNQVFIPSLTGQFALISSASKEIIESTTTDIELSYVAGVTSSIQNQLDIKANDAEVVHNTGDESVSGIKTFTDDTNLNGNVVISGDLTVNGTTTTVNSATLDVTDTNITVNKLGNDALSEGAGITVDRTGTKGSLVYENALASRFKAGDLGSESEIITDNTVQTLSGAKTHFDALISGSIKFQEFINSTSTGADATVHTANPTIRLTNGALASIAMFDDIANGKIAVITNSTGADLTIKNNSGATAGMRVLTGTGADFVLISDASVILSYDSNISRWRMIGGSSANNVRSGVIALALNDQVKTISFSSTLGTTNYSVVPSIENDIDTDEYLWLQWKILNKTNTGFDIEFNMPMNSGNYKINWKATLYA